MRATITILTLVLFLLSCRKEDGLPEKEVQGSTTPGGFITYTIPQGQHYCLQSGYRAVAISEMKFIVRFDSTAIYQAADPSNQDDINKLFGFSDNNKDHHQYSARFGWRWSNDALRLFAYVYNEGVVASEELAVVPIGSDINCSIKVSGYQYIFTVNDQTISMPRTSTTPLGKGYQLYPYFGGDETAPHQVTIRMKEELAN